MILSRKQGCKTRPFWLEHTILQEAFKEHTFRKGFAVEPLQGKQIATRSACLYFSKAGWGGRRKGQSNDFSAENPRLCLPTTGFLHTEGSQQLNCKCCQNAKIQVQWLYRGYAVWKHGNNLPASYWLQLTYIELIFFFFFNVKKTQTYLALALV